jgi:hypothetical protein
MNANDEIKGKVGFFPREKYKNLLQMFYHHVRRDFTGKWQSMHMLSPNHSIDVISI